MTTHDDDPVEPVSAAVDPVWGIRPGDVLSHRRSDGASARLAVFGVY